MAIVIRGYLLKWTRAVRSRQHWVTGDAGLGLGFGDRLNIQFHIPAWLK